MAEGVIERIPTVEELDQSYSNGQNFDANLSDSAADITETTETQDLLAEEVSLIERVKDGDQDAFANLYTLHQPAVNAWLRKLNDVHTAEDLTQETFLKAFKYFHTFMDDGRGVGPWLQRIARNVSIDASRKKDNGRLQYTDEEWMYHQEGDNFEEVVVGRVALTSELVSALDTMDDAFSDVIENIVIKGEPYADYSARVGIPKGTALSRVNRARKQLQEMRARGQIDL